MQFLITELKTTYTVSYHFNNLMKNNEKRDLSTTLGKTNNNNKIFLNNFINITGLITW